MFVQRLVLSNYRNYGNLQATLTPGVTLLWGPNAAGKSSVLEALALLALTRSPRTTADRDLIRREAEPLLGTPPFARVAGTVKTPGEREATTLEVAVVLQAGVPPSQAPNAGSRKVLRVNKRRVTARHMVGRLRVVTFQPDDIHLVTGAPDLRRTFLDMTLTQVDPRYWTALYRYRQVLAQRNRLLRLWKETTPPPTASDQLAFWDRELLYCGAYLIRARATFIAALSPLAGQLQQHLAGRHERLTLQYLSKVSAPPAADQEIILYHFRQSLQQSRRQELERGTTVVGPHLDDIALLLNDRPLAAYGSRGQQRTATLALQLALIGWMEQPQGNPPVVLLDDVLSELDPQRRACMQEWLQQYHGQVLVTASDRGHFPAALQAQATVVQISAGEWHYAAPGTASLTTVPPPARLLSADESPVPAPGPARAAAAG